MFVTGHGGGSLRYTGPHTGQRRLKGRAGDVEQIAFGHQGPVDGFGPLLKWASLAVEGSLPTDVFRLPGKFPYHSSMSTPLDPMRVRSFPLIFVMLGLFGLQIPACKRDTGDEATNGRDSESEIARTEDARRLSEQARKIQLEARRGSPEAIQQAAEKALEIYEKAYAVANKIGRDHLLEELAKAAFDANQIGKARGYAEVMLKITHRGIAFGNRIHHGNLILGRIALREGNVEEAKNRLIAAGTTPGAPTLDSFGPNMALAKELLEKGERDVVFKYFFLCSNFWDTERAQEKMTMWRDEIKAGKIPDFRAHLYY